MSDRQFFSLRYAISGFTFILLLIALNYIPLLRILKTEQTTEVFGAFLGFLTLFSGSAIGFLISQIWWWWFQRRGGIFGVEEYKKGIDAFYKIYDVENRKYSVDEKRKLIPILDFVTHSTAEKNTLILSERRWDMYHILSSTFHTLWIGAIVGILCRLFSEHFLLNPLNTIAIPDLVSTLLDNPELITSITTLAVTAVMMYFINEGRSWILAITTPLYEARIRTSTVTKEGLKDAFKDTLKDLKENRSSKDA